MSYTQGDPQEMIRELLNRNFSDWENKMIYSEYWKEKTIDHEFYTLQRCLFEMKSDDKYFLEQKLRKFITTWLAYKMLKEIVWVEVKGC